MMNRLHDFEVSLTLNFSAPIEYFDTLEEDILDRLGELKPHGRIEMVKTLLPPTKEETIEKDMSNMRYRLLLASNFDKTIDIDKAIEVIVKERKDD